MKIVINCTWGGFGLSQIALDYLGIEYCMDNDDFGIDNKNPYAYRAYDKLIECIETLGEEADGDYAELKIVEIPDDVGYNWHIDEFDGMESIHENHRHWR